MSYVKGSAFTPRMDYVKENYGEDGWSRVLSTLTSSEREELSSLLLASKWYDAVLYDHLNEAIDTIFGDADGKVVKEIGRVTAKKSLKGGPYATFARYGPAEFMKHMPRLYYAFTKDMGESEVRLTGEHAAEYVQDSGFWLRKSVEGFIEEGLLISGARWARAVSKERNGKMVCRVQWEGG